MGCRQSSHALPPHQHASWEAEQPLPLGPPTPNASFRSRCRRERSGQLKGFLTTSESRRSLARMASARSVDRSGGRDDSLPSFADVRVDSPESSKRNLHLRSHSRRLTETGGLASGLGQAEEDGAGSGGRSRRPSEARSGAAVAGGFVGAADMELKETHKVLERKSTAGFKVVNQ